MGHGGCDGPPRTSSRRLRQVRAVEEVHPHGTLALDVHGAALGEMISLAAAESEVITAPANPTATSG